MLTLILICISVNSAFSQELSGSGQYHRHDDITVAVKEFIGDSINADDESMTITAKSLDKRLKLSKCEIPLQAFWPPGASQAGHTSVGIRCNDSKPWKIYVGAQIKRYQQVWVAMTALSRGTILNRSHVALERKEIRNNSREYFSIEQNPIGLVAKRPMRRGDILQVLALEKPMAVKRGDRVIVIARVNGLEIRTAATALNAAAEGDRIRVQNLSSKKELEGVLHKNSVVHINI
ncbi:MAG: flagellar basal body P-ring formation chaperone FlgA [Gammaproteobacteria bacterium]|nr:flagellar basal body P-ring formation chaperone FlgA [Gammaproteobacteria bacterium]